MATHYGQDSGEQGEKVSISTFGSFHFLVYKVEKYKWFSIFYLVTSFFLIPLAIYGLSLINTVVLYIVVTLVTSLTCLSFILTHLQVTRPHLLPEKLKDWSFLPRQLRSFEIVDYVVQTYIEVFCCCIVERTVMLSPLRNGEVIFFLQKFVFRVFQLEIFSVRETKMSYN